MEDYDVRVQCMEYAVQLNEVGTKAKKIVSDASTFYAFLMPQKATVRLIKGKPDDTTPTKS